MDDPRRETRHVRYRFILRGYVELTVPLGMKAQHIAPETAVVG